MRFKHVSGTCTSRWFLGRGPTLVVLGALLFASLFSSTWAADWTVTPKLTVQEIYTDNITLAPNNEQSEFVTVVIPSLDVVGKGRRLNLTFSYNPQVVLYPSGDFDNQIDHQLQTLGKGELVEQLVFVDFAGTIFQSNASNTGRQATSNIYQTGNIIDTYAYRVSPFLVNRFGSYAQSEIRYGYGEVINEGPTVDSEVHRVMVDIASGSRFSSLPWTVFAEARDVNYDDGTETKFRQAGGSLRYALGLNFSVFGRGGYEFEDFGTTQKNQEGAFWQAGAIWTPSPRTKFEGGYGKRWFGSNFFFNTEYQSRRTKLRASFSQDSSLSSQINPTLLLTSLGIPGQIQINQITPTSEVVVNERFEGSVIFSGRRTNLELSGFHEDRDYEQTGDKETVFGAFAKISRNLSQRVTFSTGGGWREEKFRGGVREDTRWEANAGLTRNLGPNSDGSIEYRYTDLQSNQPVNDFQENSITITLSITL